jgi:polyhydroxybutyrate depolymerase
MLKSSVARVGPAAFALFATLLTWPFGARSQEALQERSVVVGGTQRSYTVHVPANMASRAPVVLVFHGGGGRPEAIARRTGMNDVADQNGFVVVYPAGAEAPSGRGGTWNIGGSSSPSSANDVAFVQAILADLGRSVPIDQSRIFATGISMGGVFSYRLACEMSSTFAAIAPVAATMVESSCRPQSPVAVLHIHGTDDERIPINGGRGSMTATNRAWPAPMTGLTQWSRLDGCAAQPSSNTDGCTTYSQCRATVEYCVVNGGSHTWPAGATERIWQFFAAHPKQAG